MDTKDIEITKLKKDIVALQKLVDMLIRRAKDTDMKLSRIKHATHNNSVNIDAIKSRLQS